MFSSQWRQCGRGTPLRDRGGIYGIVRAWKLSRATMRNIRENLSFALVYNAAGMPVAAGFLKPFLGLLILPISPPP